MQSFGLYCSGAVHTVIFAGFAPEAVAARINDSKAKVVFTADEAVRGNNSRT
jgi:acetyl-CoA synthetase